MSKAQNGRASRRVASLLQAARPLPAPAVSPPHELRTAANGHGQPDDQGARDDAAAVGMNGSQPGGFIWHAEDLVPRLGEYLIEMGVLQEEALNKALAVQRQRRREGQRVLLGQLLVELGFVDRATLDQAVTMQVIELQEALAQQNQQLEQQVVERTEQLEQALEQATRLQQHKDEFVNAISHELRTPLTFILGYLELLTGGDLGPLAPEQARALDRVHEATERLHQLINNLLLFASFSQQERGASCQPVVVADLFRFALDHNIQEAKEREIALLVGGPVEQTLVQADSEMIGWVITELLNNAVKFSEPGGRVHLIGQPHGDGRFQIVVRDNGPGIPPGRIREVFEPFRQLDGSTTRSAGGIGLGLALAERIVKAHGAELHIRSQPGTGTEASFSLALAS